MNDMLKEIIVNIIAPVVVALGTGIFGYLWGERKGKKQSTDAISRKEKLYLPMVEELKELSNKKLSPLNNINFPVNFDVLENNFKYKVDKNIKEKIGNLNELVITYNKINIISIAHEIIVDNFKDVFESLYETVIDGISSSVDDYGNEYEQEVEAEEYLAIKKGYSKEIKSLIEKEGMRDYKIEVEDTIDYTYSDLVDIYSYCFNITIDGKPITKRTSPPNWSGTIPEYFAYNLDFFQEFNSHPEIVMKSLLLKDIKILIADVVEDLEILIGKIVDLYEKEIL